MDNGSTDDSGGESSVGVEMLVAGWFIKLFHFLLLLSLSRAQYYSWGGNSAGNTVDTDDDQKDGDDTL